MNVKKMAEPPMWIAVTAALGEEVMKQKVIKAFAEKALDSSPFKNPFLDIPGKKIKAIRWVRVMDEDGVDHNKIEAIVLEDGTELQPVIITDSLTEDSGLGVELDVVNPGGDS